MKRRCWLALIFAIFAVTLVSCTRKQVLHVYTWCDYFSPEVVEKFEAENNCVVKFDIFDTNEMMFAKLQAGGSGYDVIVPSHYFIGKMVNENMIMPLNKASLPNLQFIDQKIAGKMNNDILNYAVPYLMSYTGLGYNKERLPDFDGTWNVYQRTDLKGRMTLLDDYAEVIGAASRMLGYTQEELDDPEKGDERMEEVVKLALTWRENIIKFENEQYKNGLSAGEFLVVMGYFSDLAQVIDESPETLAFVMPKEGCLMSCDMLVVSSAAKNPDLAHKFINYMHDPVNAAQTILDVHTYCPNSKAIEQIDPETLKKGNFLIPDEVLEKSEFMNELSPEQEARHLKYWNKIKAGLE